MQDTFDDPGITESKPKLSPLTFGIAAVALVVVLLSLWFLFQPLPGRRTSGLQEAAQTKMTAAEQDYAKNIEVANLAMSRAENFLHQEVTTLTGEIHNAGTESVSTLSLTTVFSDDMHQIVLRETRRVVETPHPALAPGERRTFEISFDHIPISWNLQAPAVTVSHLQLAAKKQ
jgi:hypothetical protein